MTTTVKELALALDGIEYREPIGMNLLLAARNAGLVVVAGASDDLAEFDGAIRDEVGVGDRTDIYVTRHGLLENKCGHEPCRMYELEKSKAAVITALWHDEGSPCWTYETDLPHATFDVLEDGEVYCRGIVFDLHDAPIV